MVSGVQNRSTTGVGYGKGGKSTISTATADCAIYHPKILVDSDGGTPGVSGYRYEQAGGQKLAQGMRQHEESHGILNVDTRELSHQSGRNNERNPRCGAGGEASRRRGGNALLTEHPRAWVYKMRQRNAEQAPPLEDKWRGAAARSEWAVGRENKPGSSLELFGKNGERGLIANECPKSIVNAENE
ncbi:hypothetical protein K438DRAFT_1771831 [Mycena galopus ATCC 62051]|nr:hypothetical protein K438DRAFT_1771831 [Mycena galopus ATCC 62051]